MKYKKDCPYCKKKDCFVYKAPYWKCKKCESWLEVSLARYTGRKATGYYLDEAEGSWSNAIRILEG